MAASLDPEPLIRLVRSGPMLNNILKNICKAEGLSSGGVKVEMQNRIIDNVRKYCATGNASGYNRLKTMLEHPESIQQPQAYPGQRYPVAPYGLPPQSMANGYHQNHAQLYRQLGPGLSGIQFKQTPFYEIKKQIGEMMSCEVMAQHRHTVKIQFKPTDYPIFTQLQTDKSLNVMVFCCEADPTKLKHDIEFPYQSELKVNGMDIKANLRGLKNKPGSTRPVNITEHLRLRQSAYVNTVEMTYALTNKRFFLVVYVVKTTPVHELVKGLEEKGKRISKESIVNEMVKKADDPDIVATSTVLSLKCPLSYMRISLPCRSISCRHNACFDATSYLQLQEQGPTWLCPVCNNSAPFDSLAVDEYVKDILSNTSSELEQVTIEPNGTWSRGRKSESPSKKGASFPSDDEDLVEIKDSKPVLGTDSTKIASALPGSMHPPQAPSRDSPASGSQTYPSISTKRPISEVIDLTSDDEEDPRPPPKRQFIGHSTPQTPHTAPTARMLPGSQ